MKKRNILVILAALCAMLFAFTACGDKKEDNKETDKKGKEDTSAVAEETTEASAETDETAGADNGENTTAANGNPQLEYIEVTEVVTDKAGVPVTDANGETKVETIMKPAPTKPSTGKEPGTSGSSNGSGNTSDSAKPIGPKVEKLIKQFDGTNDIAFEGSMSMDGQDVSVKMYMQGENVSMEVKMSIMSVRMIYADKSAKMLIPALKSYIVMPADAVGPMDMSELTDAFEDIVSSDNLDYVGTTNEKISGKSYVCETYKDGVNTNKYYFDKKDNLKRIEIIDSKGNKNVTEIDEFSTKVPANAFKVPAGYKEMSEEDLAGMMGGF